MLSNGFEHLASRIWIELPPRCYPIKCDLLRRLSPLARVTLTLCSSILLVWLSEYGYYVEVKTTVEISDNLLIRAKRYARKTHRPVRALIEEGLRLVLASEIPRPAYEMPDRSVGLSGGRNPLDQLSWDELRNEIYGDR